MPTYETVDQALDGLRDPQTFAELASAILIDELPELVMGARTGDLGRDAKVQRGIWGAEYVVVQYSLDKKWQTKIDRELGRYEDDPSLPKRMIYVTHRTATEAAQKTRVQKAAGLGVKLRIYERGWLWPRLRGRYRHLAEDLLGLRPALPGRFVTADDRRAQLEKSIPGFGAPVVDTQAHGYVREAVEAAVRDAARNTRPKDDQPSPRVMLLEGPGGMGKTRAALDGAAGVQALVLRAAQNFDRNAVGALAPHEVGVAIVDDAHRVSDLSGVRLLLDDPAWKGWHVVMTLRPGYAGEVLNLAGVSVGEIRTIAFEGLNRPQAAQLVQSPPYGITIPELARHVVELARGNPLMLHLGAQAAIRGDLTPLGQADLLRGYVRHMRRSLPEGLRGDLVTIAALYGRLSASADLAIVRHLHPAAPLPEIRSALADAADAGLGVFDGEAFSVTPEAIAPVIVLDELLGGVASRLSIDDFPLSALDDTARERVLATLSGAVVYGEGRGRDRLRRFAMRRRPQRDAMADAWLPALREARMYAHALPQDSRELLNDVVCLPDGDLRAAPLVLAAAAEVAHQLAEVSLPAGLPALLSVAALEPADGRDRLANSRKTLAELLERSPSYGGPRLTERAVEALAATRAWLQVDPGSVARQRIALRVSLMLVAVAYEFMGHSPADAMTLQLGAVPAPDTPEHREAIREAAQFAAALIAAAEPEALEELREAYPALLHRAAGIAPSLVNQLPDALKSIIGPPITTVRTAILDAWDRLPIAVRLRLMESDDNRRVTARALADPEADRFAALFGVIRAGSFRTNEWAALLQRATELGRELGPDAALDLLERALEHACGSLRISGGYKLMHGAGQAAPRNGTGKAIARMSADARLRPFLRSLLSGSLQGAGLPPSTLRDLAASSDTAIEVVDALDLVEPDEERRLMTLLLQRPAAHAALADHLYNCERCNDFDRAKTLLQLAAATSDEMLTRVLEQFGPHHGSVRVPETLRARFESEMARAVSSAALDRRDPGNLSNAFSLLVSHDGDAWLNVIDQRRTAMCEAPGEGRPWDLVPDDFDAGIGELTDQQRDQAVPRIARWLEEADHDADDWRVKIGLSDLLPRVGANRATLNEVLTSWYGAGGRARNRAMQALSKLHGYGAVEPVLDELLAASTAGDDSELIGALSMPPMSWAGDLEEEYLGRAELFAKWSHRGSSRARSFAAKAESHFRRLAESERLETRSRHEGYDD